MELMLIRHGRSLGDDEKRVEGAGWDAPLTECGIRQAKLLAGRLKNEDYSPDVVYSSPLKRALKVAKITACALGRDLVCDERLKEQDTGLIGGLTYQQAEEENPEPKGGFRSYIPTPQGESFLEHFARVTEFYSELLDRHMQDDICVVAHGFTLNHMLNAIYGLQQASPFAHRRRFLFSTGDTGIHKLSIKGVSDVVTHYLNDTSHLQKDGG